MKNLIHRLLIPLASLGIIGFLASVFISGTPEVVSLTDSRIPASVLNVMWKIEGIKTLHTDTVDCGQTLDTTLLPDKLHLFLSSDSSFAFYQQSEMVHWGFWQQSAIDTNLFQLSTVDGIQLNFKVVQNARDSLYATINWPISVQNNPPICLDTLYFLNLSSYPTNKWLLPLSFVGLLLLLFLYLIWLDLSRNKKVDRIYY